CVSRGGSRRSVRRPARAAAEAPPPARPARSTGRGGGRAPCSVLPRRSPGLGGDDAAADLVELDRFEQRLEIALAEALIALALDDLEEDRADHALGEDLQQQPLAGLGRAVDQDAALAQRRDV